MMKSLKPGYLKLLRTGELKRRTNEAVKRLSHCNLCARECGADRHGIQLGHCRTGVKAKISSYGPHHGEENPLSGRRGSGTIFFSNCNLQCQYCQNHDISQVDRGRAIEAEDIAAIMLELQERGCHNINFVSPSHVIAPILAAIHVAAQSGLQLPLVYNTGGYDSLPGLTLLDGVIDIYMPDMKYSRADVGLQYSKIADYTQKNQSAVKEMHRQVGDLTLDEDGIATRGLLVRHLVLPNDLAGTAEVVRFLAEEISTDTYLNVMGQYRPDHHAMEHPELSRAITAEEYRRAIHLAQSAGLWRLDARRPFLVNW